ncbi:hypothetical protein GCWU000341_01360 [Oribacterium sp. oral taxon 078 str. F0262]|nr:hypothetical protein GCWU000341_01360 [Oribacterium sp. oral taxon 078 str. F0262]
MSFKRIIGDVFSFRKKMIFQGRVPVPGQEPGRAAVSSSP